MKHFLSIGDLTGKEIIALIKSAIALKKKPNSDKMKNRTMFMLFEAPSLRTRVSFEAGMAQMGGHAIYYSIGESTLGKKEALKDFSCNISRYADMAMLRVYDHNQLLEFADNSSIPVINGMTNLSHPCQIASDLMTIYEKKKKLKGLKLAFLGDANNNVTHSLLIGASKIGMDIAVACPDDERYSPLPRVVEKAAKFAARSGSEIEITGNPQKAAENADVIYTDTWVSYHVLESEAKEREKVFMAYQVNDEIMKLAKKGAIFLHDQPATREKEVTSSVFDSPASAVFDQAENRMHMQKTIILELMKRKR